MPSIVTRGSFSGKAFGLTSQTTSPVYVEDVFSTYLYTGTGSNLTITNSIDLSTKGGFVWIKRRDTTADHCLFDTARGATNALFSNQSSGQSSGNTDMLNAFNTNGFTTGGNYGTGASSGTYASWTFRKQPKFFDVVTYTGNGANRTIAHNLGATPGMIIVKRTDTIGNWQVYHSGLTSAANSIQLNLSAAQSSATTVWNSTAPTSSVFSVGTDATVNASGGTYVAYIYAASNSGGFGSAGTDSVIATGTFTASSGVVSSINLGWEPQYILVRRISGVGNWLIFNNMTGLTTDQAAQYLFADTSGAETTYANTCNISATGFTIGTNITTNTGTYIYLAIRRGPMKVPTSGTSVFSPITYTGDGTNSRYISGFNFPLDMFLFEDFSRYAGYNQFIDRLRGGSSKLQPSTTAAEVTNSSYYSSALDRQNGYTGGTQDFNQLNSSGVTFAVLGFRRAPGFFDEVCYTGDGSTSTKLKHNLTVLPELLITKCRNSSTDGNSSWSAGWWVATGNSSYAYLFGPSSSSGLNSSGAGVSGGAGYFVSPDFTSSVYSPWLVTGSSGSEGPAGNVSGKTYVTYLFATCPGVSKVGIYTGTGAAQNIDCGFTAGARFVLIKRFDSTGDWYVYDSARGISSGNDPYLLLNSTAAQVTGTNYVDTFASGFTLTASAPAGLNASGGSYIFLAIS